MNMIDKLIKYEESQVGYIEKASNKDLESKVGPNVGDKNYTKYSQDLIEKVGKPFMNRVPWCVNFQNDSFIKVFDVEMAKKLLYVWTMSCGELKQAFIRHKRFFKDGQVGDLVIFEWYKTVNSKGKKELRRHIGLVYKADKNYIYTIEGNTSCKIKPKKQDEEEEVIENGGGVFKKSYSRKHTKICGYCRPNYVVAPTPVLKREKKNAPEQVKLLQEELNGLGYTDAEGKVLDIDGSFGRRTEEAVKSFQKAEELVVDGSYGPKTAAMLKSVLTEEAEKDGR